MNKTNFNSNWLFENVLRPAPKLPVDLPHDAMLTEARIPKLKDGKNTGYFPGGKYIYTKVIDDACEYDGKVVILEFEGVYMNSQVYLNNQLIGGCVSGYANFFVELTDKLVPEIENVLSVVVDNSQTPNSRWYSGSGIYRDVYLYVSDKNRIAPDGIKICTRSTSPAVVSVKIETVVNNNMTLRTEIIENGNVVAEGSGAQCDIAIPDGKLWSAEFPNLYEARTTLFDGDRAVDTATTRFGVRSLGWSATRGFVINDHPVKIRGGNVHHDHGPLGAKSFKKAELRRARIMKAAGFNAIRYSHNLAGSAFLEACDEIGLYVMNESFDAWTIPKVDYDFTLHFERHWRDEIKALVNTSYNHPSVIMYSIGNEIPETGRKEGKEISEKLANYCRDLDDTRAVTNGINFMLTGMASLGASAFKNEGSINDEVDPYNESKDSGDKGSAFVNVLITLMPFLNRVIGTAKRVHKSADASLNALDIIGINYAQHAYKKFHKLRPNSLMIATETFPKQMAKHWAEVEASPCLAGEFIWAGWDYLGESGVGVPLYGQSRGGFFKPYPCITAGCGAINLTGGIDAEGYYGAAVWKTLEKPYIGVRPVDRTGEKVFLGQWRGTDAVNSWSWPGQEGHAAEIEIYHSAAKIELIQDGTSLGVKAVVECKALFTTTYQPGKLIAISYDQTGNEIARSELISANKSTKITLLPEDMFIEAGGADLAYVAIHITDESGEIKMLSDRKISVNVEGPGELLAVGSANPWTTEVYLGSEFTTYQGRMLAIIRSKPEPGEIKLIASSEYMKSEEVVIASRILNS